MKLPFAMLLIAVASMAHLSLADDSNFQSCFDDNNGQYDPADTTKLCANAGPGFQACFTDNNGQYDPADTTKLCASAGAGFQACFKDNNGQYDPAEVTQRCR